MGPTFFKCFLLCTSNVEMVQFLAASHQAKVALLVLHGILNRQSYLVNLLKVLEHAVLMIGSAWNHFDHYLLWHSMQYLWNRTTYVRWCRILIGNHMSWVNWCYDWKCLNSCLGYLVCHCFASHIRGELMSVMLSGKLICFISSVRLSFN